MRAAGCSGAGVGVGLPRGKGVLGFLVSCFFVRLVVRFLGLFGFSVSKLLGFLVSV